MKTWEKVVAYVILTIFTVLAVFPIYWIVLTSLKPLKLTFKQPDTIEAYVPQTWGAYNEMMLLGGFQKSFVNSAIIATCSTFMVLIISAPASYGAARLMSRKAGGRFLQSLLLSQALPGVIFLIPFLMVMKFFGLVDTHIGLILSYTTFFSPFAIWLLLGFFQDIPPELEEAARVDGCSKLTAFLRVTLPLASTGVAATAILVFIFSWNEFLFALVMTTTNAKTAPVSLFTLLAQHFAKWDVYASGSVTITIPVIIFYLIIRRYIVRGITLGGVKG